MTILHRTHLCDGSTSLMAPSNTSLIFFLLPEAMLDLSRFKETEKVEGEEEEEEGGSGQLMELSLTPHMSARVRLLL